MPFGELTEAFGSERLVGARLDRFPRHVSILEMNGESFRINQRRVRKNKTTAR